MMVTNMFRYRKKRLYSIFAFLGVVATLFLFFQVFSHQVLTVHSHSESKKYKRTDNTKHPSSMDTVVMEKQNHKVIPPANNNIPEEGFDKDCSREGNCDEFKIFKNKEDFKKHKKNQLDAGEQKKIEKFKRRKSKYSNRGNTTKRTGSVLKYKSKKHDPSKEDMLQIAKQKNAAERLGQQDELAKKQSQPKFQNSPADPWLAGYGIDVDVLYLQGMKDAKRLLGVHPQLTSLYKEEEGGTFTCLSSKEHIPFFHVNDDYCDCQDGSDEPGTSACIDFRFYCTFQTKSRFLWVNSGKVHDGICDCCDGSDEENIHSHLPSHVQLDDQAAHYGLYQAPCVDHCDVLRSQEVGRLSMLQEGAKLRQQYLKAGYGRGNVYGPNGAFYKLSLSCYKITADKYEYTLCPFKDIKQQSFPKPSKNIGNTASWESKGPTDYKLLMDHGDSDNCPQMSHRRSLITFECGLEDRVLSVKEDERCLYIFTFSTPAACT